MLKNVLNYQSIILNGIQFGGAFEKYESKIVHNLINVMVYNNGCYGVEKRNLVIK